MTTYVEIKPPGYERSIVVRTEESRQRAAKRAVLRSPNFIAKMTAQEAADEAHLSRSKAYMDIGKRERERRLKGLDR